MIDLTHWITNLFDHNRGTVFGGAAIAGVLCLASCAAYDGEVVSSSSGAILSGDELVAEFVTNRNRIEGEWDAAIQARAAANVMLSSLEREATDLDLGLDLDLEGVRAEENARLELVSTVGTLAGPAAPWLAPLLGIGLTSLAGGVGYDNIRKSRKIRTLKSEEGTA